MCPYIDGVIHKKVGLVKTREDLTLGSRRVALFLSHRMSGLSLREIGKFFGMGPSGVTQNTRRVEVLLKGNKKLIKEVERLKKILSK